MDILIIGGTRNMGHFLSLALLDAGHTVTVLNRGITRDDLPDTVERLRADRTIPAQLEQAIGGRTFDAVVDFVMFNGEQARVAVDLFQDRTDHYIYISSGQVYLLLAKANRPYSEEDYEGDLIPEPPLNTYDHEEWLYGMQKRRAEDTFAHAHAEKAFPYTSLRLPMVNGERDPFNRLYAYMLRLRDNGPILVPDAPDYPLRHVYSGDVVRVIVDLLESGDAKGGAYNLSQDETVALSEFLHLLGEQMDIEPDILRVSRGLLEANGFLPDCSPFSDKWMSELDNTRSKTDLGVSYTALRTYIENIVTHYQNNPPKQPTSYRRRQSERQFAGSHRQNS